MNKKKLQAFAKENELKITAVHLIGEASWHLFFLFALFVDANIMLVWYHFIAFCA